MALPSSSRPAPSQRASWWERARTAGPLSFALLAFVLSRIHAANQGVRFDSGTLDWFFQFIEPRLLRERLLESVSFLHSQPPLFNLFLGGVLKAAPEAPEALFSSLYTLAGVLLTLCLYGLLVRLQIPRWPSALLTALFMANPATVLYEHWLFYTYPETVLLCGSALLLHRFAVSRRPGAGALFFAALGILALTRSSFHLVWYLAMVGLAVGLVRASWRTLLLAATPPLLVLLALYTKNAVYFGSFSASSWFGMNLAQIALKQAPIELRWSLVQEGRASRLALVDAFLPLSNYPPEYRVLRGPDVPVLRLVRKQGGIPNFNHVAYVQVSQGFAKDALAMVRAHPDSYLHTAWKGLRLFLAPTSDYPFLSANRRHVLDELEWSNLFLGGMYGARSREAPHEWLSPEDGAERTHWNWVALLFIGWAGTLVGCWEGRRRTGTFHARDTTRMFLALNILYVVLVSNLFEYGENNRLRFPIDPLVLALGAAGLADVGRFLRARFKRSIPMPSNTSTRNSKTIKAPRERVYEAFLNPEELVAWLPPGEMTGKFHAFDARVGGGYDMSLFYPPSESSFRGKTADTEDRTQVRFVELTPPHRIVETFRFVTTDPTLLGEMTLTVMLEEVPEGTEVTLLFENLPPGLRAEDNEAGARLSLDQLARHLER